MVKKEKHKEGEIRHFIEIYIFDDTKIESMGREYVDEMKEKEEQETKEIDYKQEVIDSIDKEFKAYEAELLKGTTENVFCHSYETSVKTEFREAICGEVEFDDNVYKALYQEKGKILENLHQDFIGQSHASVNSFEETGIFVEDYCNRYYKEIMNEQDEAPQMGMG